MTIQDGFCIAVALAVEDGTATGFSSDPSKRRDVFGMFGIQSTSNVPSDGTDPMNTPPPAHLAEEQLAEFRALMGGGKPPDTGKD